MTQRWIVNRIEDGGGNKISATDCNLIGLIVEVEAEDYDSGLTIVIHTTLKFMEELDYSEEWIAIPKLQEIRL